MPEPGSSLSPRHAREDAASSVPVLDGLIANAVAYAGIGVWEYCPGEGTLVWDRIMYDQYGIVQDTPMTVRLWEERVSQEDAERMLRMMGRVLLEGGQGEHVVRVTRKDATIRHLQCIFGQNRNERTGRSSVIGVSIDVTGKVKELEALTKREQQLNKALEATGAAVWDWDPAAKRIYYSSLWKSILGYEDSEISDAQGEWETRLHPDDKAGVFRDIERHTKGDTKVYENEHRLLCKDGTYKWVLERGLLVERDPDGQPRRFTGTMMDLSARKAAEEALRQSRTRLAHAQNLAKIGSWEWNLETGDIQWSDEVYRIFGLSKGEFIPDYERYLSIVHPLDRQKLISAIEGALAFSGGYNLEHRVIHLDGTVRHIQGIGQVHLSENGNPVRFTGTVQDVTEKVMAEGELRARDAMLQAMSEAAHDALIIIDSTDTIILWNNAAESMFGYEKDEVLGHKFHELVVPTEYHEKAREGLKQFSRTGTGAVLNSVMEFTAIRKNREVFPVERSVAAFRRGGRWYAVGSLRDITSRKTAEEQLKEMATRDSLTGLSNRRHFQEMATLLFSTAQRYNTPFSIMIFDVDHFKWVNDNYGHESGDELLRQLASTTRATLRAVDVPGRWGGEEFVVAMPETDLDGAILAGERLRKAVADLVVHLPAGDLSRTVSVGLACASEATASVDDVIRLADTALYAAKTGGRNKVEYATV